MAYSDPHDEFEKRLQAQGYVPLPDFAVLDECEFYDKKTRQHVHLDEKRLEKMAASQNKRIEGRNSGTPVILGHTKDDAPESEQPEVVGMATRFRVAPLPDGKAAIWARPWARPGHEKTFKNNFRRSVELWLDPDAIDPIAILGATTPRRDLPDHIFARYGDAEVTSTGSRIRFSRSDDGRQPILFEMRQDMAACSKCGKDPCECKGVKCDMPGAPVDAPAPDATPAPGGDLVNQLFASDQWKQLMAQVSQNSEAISKIMPIFEELEQEAMGGAGGEAPPGGAPPSAPPAAAPGGAPADAPGGDAPAPGGGDAPGGDAPAPDDDEERDGPPNKRNSAMGSAAGFHNTSMPNYQYSRQPWGPDMADNEVRIRMQRLEADYAAITKTQAELVKENAALRLARIEDEVNVALAELSREGYAVVTEIDRPELCRLSQADRNKKIKFMRDTRVKKEPQPALPNGGNMPIDPAQVAQPLKFSRDDAIGVGPDPAALPQRAPDDYEALMAMAGTARKKGIDLRSAFDVSQLTPAAANGVAVR